MGPMLFGRVSCLWQKNGPVAVPLASPYLAIASASRAEGAGSLVLLLVGPGRVRGMRLGPVRGGA